MSLLYTNLKSIYNKYNYFQNYHPVEPVYVILRDYLIQNIKFANLTIDPMDFANKHYLDTQKTLDLFLILSEYSLFIKQYFLTCDECGSPSIENELEDFYECMYCKNFIFKKSITQKIDIFNNIKYVFEINEELLLELKNDLKTLPSSSFNKSEEEGNTTQLTVNTILENPNPLLEGIKHERNLLNKLREGILEI